MARTVDRADVVGRGAERDAVLAHLRAGRSVAVHGPAGIGKTTLVRSVATALGGPTREGGALAALSWRAYLPLARAVGQLDLGAEPAQVAERVAAAVGDGLLVLDDLHWADPETLELLPLLVRRGRLLVVVRTADAGGGAASVAAAAAGCASITLGPLADEDAAALVRRRRPGLTDDELGRVLDRAGGNPLFLTELGAAGEVPETLGWVLGARLLRSGPDAARAMAVLGLLGRPAPAALLEPGLVELLDAGVVERVAGLVQPRHALLAEHAVTRLSEAERVSVHRLLAAAVPDPGESARHHAAAGDLDLARAAALAAAETAAQPGERARHLHLAAVHGGDPDLCFRAANALLAAGRHGDADAVVAGIDPPDAGTRAEVALFRARAYCQEGRSEPHRRYVAEGLALVAGTRTPTEVRLRIERAWAALGLDFDADAVLPLAEEAMLLATEVGVERERARALLMMARRIAGTSGPDDGAGPASVVDPADPEGRCSTALAEIYGHVLDGRPAAAEEMCEELVAECGLALMLDWERAFRETALTVRLHRRGADPQYVASCRALLDEPLMPKLRASVASRLAVAAGDLGETADAEAVLRTAQPQAVEALGRATLQWARAETELAAGRPARALAAADAGLAEDLGWHPIVTLLGIARMWARFDLDAEPVDDLPDVQHYACFSAVPAERRGLAALAGDAPADAVVAFDEATRAWAGQDRRGELRCRWAAAEAARRAGAADAVARLQELRAVCEETGQGGLLGRVRRSARAAGIGPRPERAEGGVTAREREILDLVGRGFSSPAIAGRLGTARSTVDAQIVNAMRKLGARTRWEAAGMLDRTG